MKLVSVDIETTGLNPREHEAWEVAIVPVDEPDRHLHFHLPVTLNEAEPRALEIGGYERRYLNPPPGRAIFVGNPAAAEPDEPMALNEALAFMYEALEGATLLGACVHFDAAFIAELIGTPWSHRHLDVGSYFAGVVGAAAPMSTSEITEYVPNPDAHNALADARWNIEVYQRALTVSRKMIDLVGGAVHG